MVQVQTNRQMDNEERENPVAVSIKVNVLSVQGAGMITDAHTSHVENSDMVTTTAGRELQTKRKKKHECPRWNN